MGASLVTTACSLKMICNRKASDECTTSAHDYLLTVLLCLYSHATNEVCPGGGSSAKAKPAWLAGVLKYTLSSKHSIVETLGGLMQCTLHIRRGP